METVKAAGFMDAPQKEFSITKISDGALGEIYLAHRRRLLGEQPGFDIFVPNQSLCAVADKLIAAAKGAGGGPCGWTAFETVRAALPALKAAVAADGDASVINVSSMYGRVAPDGRLYDRREQQSPFHYGPAKAGLEQLTRHLAAELGPSGVRVNTLVPGAFPQPGKMPAGLEPRLADRTMLGRIGAPSEIAGPLLFLAAPASTYMTGASLVVDGGWTAW